MAAPDWVSQFKQWRILQQTHSTDKEGKKFARNLLSILGPEDIPGWLLKENVDLLAPPRCHGYHEFLISRRPVALILERGWYCPRPQTKTYPRRQQAPWRLELIIEALANEDTLLRTHCCRHKCFPVCSRAQRLLRTQILCPGHKKCFWFCSETFCVRNKCFPVCPAQETSWALTCPRLPAGP